MLSSFHFQLSAVNFQFHKLRYLPILLIFLVTSCAKGPQIETEIYFNDFEGSDLKAIAGGQITSFNQSNVIGRYNNGGFSLQLNDLEEHDLIEISFDLYLHDSWDGNLNGDLVGGPDIWMMNVDAVPFIHTTFSNLECPVQTCVGQSYPAMYPNYNNGPRAGAFRGDLPGVCQFAGKAGGSTQYKITKTLKHRGRVLTLECLDELKQKNAPSELCDESWSVDNIRIKGIKLN